MNIKDVIRNFFSTNKRKENWRVIKWWVAKRLATHHFITLQFSFVLLVGKKSLLHADFFVCAGKCCTKSSFSALLRTPCPQPLLRPLQQTLQEKVPSMSNLQLKWAFEFYYSSLFFFLRDIIWKTSILKTRTRKKSKIIIKLVYHKSYLTKRCHIETNLGWKSYSNN